MSLTSRKGELFLKTNTIIAFFIVLLIVAVGCFVGGVVYANKTSGIPEDGYFEVNGYFTNIQKGELIIFDGEYPYFTNGTGASKEEAEEYKAHPENYSAYTADLIVKNISNYDISPVWAVLPGYQANYRKVTSKQDHSDSDKQVWLDCWLSEGVVSLSVGETLNTKLHFIVKRNNMNDQEIQAVLENLQMNLQLGICGKSQNPQYDISRNISFVCPIFYKN